MADWPFDDSSRYISAGTAKSSAGGTVTAGVVNTKGAYVAIAPSIPFDVDEVWINTKVHLVQAFSRYFLYDIAIGTPGAEVTIADNICLSPNSNQYGHSVYLPFTIPQGQNISCRTQSNGAGAILSVSFVLGAHGFANFSSHSRMKTYGALTATSRATMVSPGGVANTKGAWSQITASTTEDITAIELIMNDETNLTGLAVQGYLMDVGVGAAGQEQVVIPDLDLVTGSPSSTLSPLSIGPMNISIPARSRIAVRAQTGNSNTLQNPIGVVIIGFSR